MWKSVLSGLILGNIETLKHYQAMKDMNPDAVDNILQYVSGVVAALPWYFRFPVLILANVTALLCLIATGHRLDLLSSEKRSLFLRRVRFVPLFDMLNKLVRSMAFLKLFDVIPMSPRLPGSINHEGS